MVNSPSAAAQANDLEQKRRKQTLERAKANHLSRQLQMRLQYAKLKVDHGWQKQNLNEVENLYFHHSHMRGSRPYPTPMMTTFAHPTQAVLANSHSAQSNLSFRQHLGGVRVSAVAVSVAGDGGVTVNAEHGDANGCTSEPHTQTSVPPPPPSADPDPSPVLGHALLSLDTEILDQDQTPTTTTTTTTTIAVPTTSTGNRGTPPLARIDFQSLTRTATVTSPTRPSKSKPRLKPKIKAGHSMSPASSSSNSPHKQNAASGSALAEADTLSSLQGMSGGRGSPFQGGGHGIAVMGHHNMSSDGSSLLKGSGNNGGYGFASSAMTYDSFWSSHSSSSAGVVGGSMRDVMRGN